MNVHEARLAILDRIRDLLLDLADEDTEMDDDEYAEAELAMASAADLILEVLGLDVVSVDDAARITATMYLGGIVASVDSDG